MVLGNTHTEPECFRHTVVIRQSQSLSALASIFMVFVMVFVFRTFVLGTDGGNGNPSAMCLR